MTEDVLAEAMVPFVFDMADDLATKELLKDQPYDAWIFCHSGVRYGAVRDLAQKNIDHIQNQLAACAALVREPMTYSQFYAAVITTMDLPVGHPARAMHLERYIRPYLEYLIDRGDVDPHGPGRGPRRGPQGVAPWGLRRWSWACPAGWTPPWPPASSWRRGTPSTATGWTSAWGAGRRPPPWRPPWASPSPPGTSGGRWSGRSWPPSRPTTWPGGPPCPAPGATRR